MVAPIIGSALRTPAGPSKSKPTNVFHRPTLLGLMLLIAYVAVVLAAIRADTYIWTGIVMYLTVFILGTTTLLAIHRRGAWAGFAIFGWAYFLIFQPDATERGPASVSMRFTYDLVRSFSQANVPPYSLRSGLCLASVAMGLLGALIGWRIGRASETNHPERNPTGAE